MLLPNLRFWLEVEVARGTNSAPSSKPDSFFSSCAKLREHIPKISISKR
jgi:hypothetical protein